MGRGGEDFLNDDDDDVYYRKGRKPREDEKGEESYEKQRQRPGGRGLDARSCASTGRKDVVREVKGIEKMSMLGAGRGARERGGRRLEVEGNSKRRSPSHYVAEHQRLKRDARIAKRIGAVSYNSYSSLTTDSTIGVVGVFDDRTTDDRQEPQATCALPCLSHNASKGQNRASRTSLKCRYYLTSALFFFLGLGA